MTTADDHPYDEVAVYAVDGLDGPERAELERHLAQCERCRSDLATHRETLAELVAPEAPPPEVWGRIEADIDAEAEARRGSIRLRPRRTPLVRRTSRGGREAGRRRGRGRVSLVVATVAASVALLLGVAAGRHLNRDRSPDDVAALAQEALNDGDSRVAVLSSPDGDPVARVVAGEEGAFVVLDELSLLDADRVYQLWHLDGTTPVSLGVVGEGGDVAATTLPIGVRRLAVTVEPAGGVPTPTGPIVARGAMPPTT